MKNVFTSLLHGFFLVFINTTDLSVTESAELESVEAQMSLGMP